MVYAAVAFSTIAKGRIVAIDTAAAEAAPGVVLVMTYQNAPRLQAAPVFQSHPKAMGPDSLPVMQDDRVRESLVRKVTADRNRAAELADYCAVAVAVRPRDDPVVDARELLAPIIQPPLRWENLQSTSTPAIE